MLMLWMNSSKISIRNAGSWRDLLPNMAVVFVLGISIARIGQAQLVGSLTSDLASVASQPSEPTANDEDVKAVYQRGVVYIFGSTANHDYLRAVEDLRQAATGGLTDADLVLGYLYERGQGVQKEKVT